MKSREMAAKSDLSACLQDSAGFLRLLGGVRNHMRTGLAWISPENREFFEEFNK
jgi:hypothetical protein